MGELFNLIPHAGVIFCVLCSVAALAAFIYIPDPFKHYATDALLVLGLASFIYGDGYAAAERIWKSKFDVAMADINAENEKAVVAAEERVRATDAANATTLKTQLDLLTAQHDADQLALKPIRNEIAKAGADADTSAPSLILDAIRSAK